MNSWEKIPIGEIFSLEKGSLQSSKCTPGDYTFITASSEWKTHNEYSHDCEALIYAVAASGSLGRCHHYSGKFISSDLCFILRAKDEKKRPINYRFYQNVFRFLKDDIVAKTKAGTSKESISQKRFSAYRLPYIDIEHQLYWENKLNNLNDEIENIEGESTNQSSYLAKLRQAILQEAIEGKLTVDWRKENPVRKGDPDYDAEALLEKIQAEKEKLIKEGKIKKQKPLAPIKAEELPFELPVGWVWVILDDIVDFFNGKAHEQVVSKAGKYILVNSKFVSMNGAVIKRTNNQMSPLLKNDIAIVMSDVPNGRALARCFLADENNKYSLNQRIGGLTSLGGIYPSFLYLTLDRNKYFIEFDDGKKQTNLRKDQILSCPICLPSLLEQQAIVDRVEKLLSMVDELEKQVSERKELSKQLMQAVLREAFEGGK